MQPVSVLIEIGMQRWFFLEDQSFDKKRKKKVIREISVEKMMSPEEQISVHEPERSQRKFCVIAPGVKEFETVCISGTIKELGEWKYNKVIPLVRQSSSNLWSKTIAIPLDRDIYFRYCICAISEESKNIYVRQFENNVQPRKLSPNCEETHVFGNYDGKTSVASGWITGENLVQFKFALNPIKLKSCLLGHELYIKVTPISLAYDPNTNVDFCGDDNLNATDPNEASVIPNDILVEVSTLSDTLSKLQPQEDFGRVYKPDDFLIFNLTVPNLEALAYLIDIYTHSTRGSYESPPYHLGYTYVLPTMLKKSAGRLELPLTCNVKYRPLGTVNVEYLIVKSMNEQLCDLRVSYMKHWEDTWKGLDVGHRGSGSSFKTKEGTPIRENTIASLKNAASSGADLLEFDVQLSKDMVPVIYHDFHICISLKRKQNLEYGEMLEIPLKYLTLEQLQNLKVYHLVEGRTNEQRFFDEEFEDHQPFPTLVEAFQAIDPNVGFNVEMKWTMELDDGTFELNNPFDINVYVDKVLEVILQHGGDRPIVISCFNPDICTLVRHKQIKYPVMFLTQGKTEKYPRYLDPRCLSMEAAVQHAISTDILGIVAHTEDLLRDKTQVKLATNAGLILFCWGDDNNNKDTIQLLKNLGLHGVIFDKLDQLSTKSFKESIFLVEARESQKDLYRQAALNKDVSPESSRTSSQKTDYDSLDTNLREKAALNSTATSLQSLIHCCNIENPTTNEGPKSNAQHLKNQRTTEGWGSTDKNDRIRGSEMSSPFKSENDGKNTNPSTNTAYSDTDVTDTINTSTGTESTKKKRFA